MTPVTQLKECLEVRPQVCVRFVTYHDTPTVTLIMATTYCEEGSVLSTL